MFTGCCFTSTALSILRESTVHTAAYLRYRVAEDNRVIAEELRLERDERLIRKEEEATAWAAYGRQQVAERIKRQERSKKQQRDLMRRRSQQAVKEREEMERTRDRLGDQQQVFYDKARQRVLQASALDERLDESEAVTAAAAAAEGKKSKEEVQNRVAEVRQHMLETKKAMASQIKFMHAKATSELSGHIVSVAAARGSEKREASRQWGIERGRREVSYIERARVNRERAIQTRQAAKVAMAQAAEARKKAAAKERANDHLVTKERVRAPPCLSHPF